MAEVDPYKTCNALDKVGAASSFTCAIHCAIMPFVITMLPYFGLGWLASEKMEWGLFFTSAVIALSSLCMGYRSHRRQTALRIGAIALAVLGLGRYGDMHHWTPYYVICLVLGGFGIATSHVINHYLCKSCKTCDHAADHDEDIETVLVINQPDPKSNGVYCVDKVSGQILKRNLSKNPFPVSRIIDAPK
jgi:hypothetical protein